jgi:hypothetical protein
MSAAQTTANKATYGRLVDAGNSGDVEFISKTIDEVVEPDLRIRRRLPVEATGAQALRQRPNRRDVGVVDVLPQMKQLGGIPV